MPDKVRGVAFLSKGPVYEIVVPENGVSITIRSAEDHSKQVSVSSGAVPLLIKALEEEYELVSRTWPSRGGGKT